MLSDLYRKKGGYRVLAERYFANLLNGRFLWRNRYGTNRILRLHAPFDEIADTVFPIRDFAEPSIPADLMAEAAPWITGIVHAFEGEIPHFVLQADTVVTIGAGQEVYPSQEFVDIKGNKSKTLFSIKLNGEDVAGMHSQKIGNAIRTIDNWYPGATPDAPLAVDPFTVNKRKGKTVRLPERGKSDFYSYLKDVPSLAGAIEAAPDAAEIPDEAHYFMSVLIRGGVFSGESQKKQG